MQSVSFGCFYLNFLNLSRPFGALGWFHIHVAAVIPSNAATATRAAANAGANLTNSCVIFFN